MLVQEILVLLVTIFHASNAQSICVCQFISNAGSWGSFLTNWGECTDRTLTGVCTRIRQRSCTVGVVTNCDVQETCTCGAQWGPWSNTNQCTSICGRPGEQQQSRTCYIDTNRRTKDCVGSNEDADQHRTQTCTRTQPGCTSFSIPPIVTIETSSTLPTTTTTTTPTTRTRVQETTTTSTQSPVLGTQEPPSSPPILAGNDLIILASILGSVTVICIAIVAIVVVIKKKKQQQPPVLQNTANNNIMFEENRSRGGTMVDPYPPALPIRQTTIMSDNSARSSLGAPKTVNNTLYHEITPSSSNGTHHNEQLPVPKFEYDKADVSTYSSAEPVANPRFGQPSSDGYLSPLPISPEESLYFSIDEMGTMK